MTKVASRNVVEFVRAIQKLSEDDLEGFSIRWLREISKRSAGVPTPSDDPNGQGEENMSLEKALADNTAALIALTAAMAAGGGKAAAGTTPKADTKAATKETKGKYTKPATLDLLTKVKEKFDVATAVALRNEFGKVKQMDDLVDPAAIDALYEACEKKLTEEPEGGGDGL